MTTTQPSTIPTVPSTIPTVPSTIPTVPLSVEVPAHLSSLPNAPKGWDWRPQQPDLVSRVANSPKPIVLLQAEPGIGKTVMAWALLKALNRRGIILVHTRQLERQYTQQFRDVSLMEGRRHYICNISNQSAEFAPCSIGVSCQLKKFGCNYYTSKIIAANNLISIHNYAYWLSETRHNPKSLFRQTDVIICDEAHDIQSVLMESEVITIGNDHCKRVNLERPPRDLAGLTRWAWESTAALSTRLNMLIEKAENEGLPVTVRSRDEELSIQADDGIDMDFKPTEAQVSLIREIRDTDSMLTNVAGVRNIRPEDEGVEWIVDTSSSKTSLSVKPMFGKRGFARILAASRFKVVLMSAYLAPHLLIKNLGIDPEQVEIIEANQAYDRTKSQVYYCPVVKMRHSTSEAEWRKVVKVIDAIIDDYSPKSGMIHVPSVHLRDTILRLSKHRTKIISYDGIRHPNRRPGAFTKDQAIAQFKSRSGQRILLGQSISTGVDIPYIPEFNIIVKVPFAPTVDPVVKARHEVDKAYLPFLAICDIVQAMGRGKRAPDHHCDTFILDAQFGWFYLANREHFPSWFVKNYKAQGWKDKVVIKKALMRQGVIVL